VLLLLLLSDNPLLLPLASNPLISSSSPLNTPWLPHQGIFFNRAFVIQPLDLSNVLTALQVFGLQKLAYTVEANLIGRSDIPPLLETLQELQSSAETFYGYFKDQVLAAAISYKHDEEVLDIYRLMVHPDYFRQGLAGLLLEFIETQEPQCSHIVVATGSLNTPAIGFYKSRGFREVSSYEVTAGFSITTFEKIKVSSV
jgi:ribosomal protein S18 acetylase RimI-like enzyme